jgi:hypothetical protein
MHGACAPRLVASDWVHGMTLSLWVENNVWSRNNAKRA